MAHLMVSVTEAFAESERSPITQSQGKGIALTGQRGAYIRTGKDPHAGKRKDALAQL